MRYELQKWANCVFRMTTLMVIGTVLVASLCGCSGPRNYVSVSFVTPDEHPLASQHTIVTVRLLGIILPPSFHVILRWIGIKTFRNLPTLTFFYNKSKQLNDTGCIWIPEGAGLALIYVFALENRTPFIYCDLLYTKHTDNPTTIQLFPLNSMDARVLEMQEEWAYLLGDILLSKSDLLSVEQITELRRYITPLASEEFYKECQYISPKALRERAKECGVEVRK